MNKERIHHSPGTDRTNRLMGATSPYLLQHAHNPVDWQPWDKQALDLAIAQDKPIFLSIGYAACHWCHVMERESFEDPGIAAIMNRYFVNIKVDREERPDLDELYMNAVVAMTGRGGWPMSVFLTPDLQPFYSGTYFPPQDRYGMPGFARVLEEVARAWRGQRDKIQATAQQIIRHLEARQQRIVTDNAMPTASDMERAATALDEAYDAVWGGWGGAPKFPSPASIALLLRHYCHTNNSRSLAMATTTLERMARGGIYDHVGGGFHRYAVDEEWLVPHFEKMLYDNAQMASVYLDAWQITGKTMFRDVARQTLDYLLRDMRHEQGGFFASEDADSEGEEGKFYLWRRREILDLLGDEYGAAFCEYYMVREEGNFPAVEACHREMNILHINPSQATADDTAAARMAVARQTLLAVRSQRARPFLDEKIITSWNALTISAFAQAAQCLGDKAYYHAALGAGMFLRSVFLSNNGLVRCWRDGKTSAPAFLDDYCFTTSAFIDLYEMTLDHGWLRAARDIADSMMETFHDTKFGAFFTTAEHPHLFVRMKPLQDGAEPSGNAMAARALLRLAAYFGEERYAATARHALRAAMPMARRTPLGYLHSLLTADILLHAPVEIVLAGAREHPDMVAMRQMIGEQYLPNRILAYAGSEEKEAGLAVVEGRAAPETGVLAFLCQERQCMPPASTPETLKQQLEAVARHTRNCCA